MNNRLIKEIQRRMDALNLDPTTTAKKAGLGESFVRDILRGKSIEPATSKLGKVAKVLGCTVADLTGDRYIGPKNIQADSVSINELDVHAAAGLGGDIEDNIMSLEEVTSIVGTFSFPASGFRETYGAAPAGVKMIAVRGDSMVPALWPGQRCMVDTNDRLPSPPGVFVIFDGLGLVLKRIELIPGTDPQRIRLSSDNVLYQAYERTLDEAYINGRVIGVWSRF